MARGADGRGRHGDGENYIRERERRDRARKRERVRREGGGRKGSLSLFRPLTREIARIGKKEGERVNSLLRVCRIEMCCREIASLQDSSRARRERKRGGEDIFPSRAHARTRKWRMEERGVKKIGKEKERRVDY